MKSQAFNNRRMGLFVGLFCLQAGCAFGLRVPRGLLEAVQLPADGQAGALSPMYSEYFEYLAKFGKKYDTTEEMHRHFKLYCQNIELIAEHNRSSSSYKQGVNKFTDMSNEEFEQGYVMNTGFDKPTHDPKGKTPAPGEAK